MKKEERDRLRELTNLYVETELSKNKKFGKFIISHLL